MLRTVQLYCTIIKVVIKILVRGFFYFSVTLYATYITIYTSNKIMRQILSQTFSESSRDSTFHFRKQTKIMR